MGLTISANRSANSNFAPIEPGTYPARCCAVIDLGLQVSEWQGERKLKPQVVLIFELPTERITVNDEDKPRWLSEYYTASLFDNSALKKMLDSWRGKPMTAEEQKRFNVGDLINAPCMLTVAHREKKTGGVKEKITGVGKPMKGVPIPELENEPILFDMDRDDAGEVFGRVPAWLQRQIEESSTWQEYKKTHLVPIDSEDDGELPW